MLSAPYPDHRTRQVEHTTRIARASVGKRARARARAPSGIGTHHHTREPTAALIDWPVVNMTDGITLITSRAHPVCPMAKLTRSRRPAADARAACNTPLTRAVERAAPGVVLRAAAVADREGEVAAPRPPALDSASAPRRSRRQPARPRSSRVGSRAMAMAAVKAIDVRRQSSRWLYARVASSASRSSANAAEALPLAHRQESSARFHGRVSKRTPPSHARARHCPVPTSTHAQSFAKVESVTHHAAAPTLGGAEPRLVLVEPEPQAIRRSEPFRHEVILLRRADAGRCAPVLLAQVHAAEERGGALGRHEEAAGAGRRGGPAGWAGGCGSWAEEDSGGHQHPSTDAHASSGCARPS
eukprot:scaffold103261_cov84-Phaeocystis_antarctica.AAC.1